MVAVGPNNLLMSKRVVSSVEDMGLGTLFHRTFDVADETIHNNPGNVKANFL